MRATATRLRLQAQPEATTQTFGCLVGFVGDSYDVRTSAGRVVRAKRALACLVEPRVGDEVLVAGEVASGRHYVLAVLEREDTRQVDLSAPGDIGVKAPGGSVSVTARDDVRVGAGSAIRFVAQALGIDAAEAKIGLKAVAFVGGLVEAQASTLRVVAKAVDTVAERLSARVQRSYRFIQDIDMTRTRRCDYAAEETLHMRASDTIITAHTIVKVDGAQIQLG